MKYDRAGFMPALFFWFLKKIKKSFEMYIARVNEINFHHNEFKMKNSEKMSH